MVNINFLRLGSKSREDTVYKMPIRYGIPRVNICVYIESYLIQALCSFQNKMSIELIPQLVLSNLSHMVRMSGWIVVHMYLPGTVHSLHLVI